MTSNLQLVFSNVELCVSYIYFKRWWNNEALLTYLDESVKSCFTTYSTFVFSDCNFSGFMNIMVSLSSPTLPQNKQTNSVALSPQANYTN
jgi:hypothetical protein